jgi:hypothetical protein
MVMDDMSAAYIGSAWADMVDKAPAEWPMAEKSTHPLDFHDHDGDGFDRAVTGVKSAGMACMEVDVCIVGSVYVDE